MALLQHSHLRPADRVTLHLQLPTATGIVCQRLLPLPLPLPVMLISAGPERRAPLGAKDHGQRQ